MIGGYLWPNEERPWGFIYKVWIAMSYAWQAFGVVWLLWGCGLAVWVSKHSGAKWTEFTGSVLALALVIPFIGIFVGALLFRRWMRARLALWKPAPPTPLLRLNARN